MVNLCLLNDYDKWKRKKHIIHGESYAFLGLSPIQSSVETRLYYFVQVLNSSSVHNT